MAAKLICVRTSAHSKEARVRHEEAALTRTLVTLAAMRLYAARAKHLVHLVLLSALVVDDDPRLDLPAWPHGGLMVSAATSILAR